jgi:hypothetical protein
MSLTPTSQGPDKYAYPGSTPSISANGTTNGIVWAVDIGTNQLRAYNATGFNTELYTSAQAANSRDALTGSVVKFAVPTVADGLVFVGTSNALNVYGLLAQATQPPAAPSNLTATALSGTSVQLTWKDNSTAPNTAAGFDIEQSTDGVNFTQVATASAGSTSFTVGGLTVSTTYTFRVRAFNAIGNSGFSNTASAMTTSQVPTLNFSTGFANASSLLTFNGTAKVNGTALQLTDGGNNEAASAFSTSKVDVTHFSTQFSFQLTAGTSTADGFTFTIQTAGNTARGPAGGGLGYGPDHTGGTGGIPTSVAVKFDLYNNQGEGVDSTGLYIDGAAPTNVGSIDLTSTGINLHSGDKINVSMTYDGTTLTVTESDPTVNKSASQSYTINIPNTVGGGTAFVGFTGGTGGVTAVQDILTWTYTPTSSSTAPAAPSNLAATAASATQVNLTWTNNATNQTGFHIDRATDSAFTQNLVTQSAGASATSFVDSGLTAGTTYFYRVRAFNAVGDSPNSNTASVTTPTLPAAVSNLRVTKVTFNEVDLSWTNNATNATSIQVFRKQGGNNPILIASLSPTTTSLADTGLVAALQPGTTYTYNVQAVNAAGPSPVTSVTATTASRVLAIACGNSAVSPFVADTDFSGGTVSRGTTATINTSHVTNPAPMSVYQHGRYGNITYTIPNLTAGATYAVRLDFVEYIYSASGQRVFNVAINGTQVLSNFDIFVAAGGENIALAKVFSATASSSGTITITFTSVVNNSMINGIEVYTDPTAPAGTQVSLASYFNQVGIVRDGSTFTGGLDGGGSALSGNLLGISQTWNGTAFTLGAVGGNNVVSAAGQTINLPSGNFSTLKFLATAVNGNQPNQTFVVTYTDGTTQTFIQGVSDWFTPQGYSGESDAVDMAYRDVSNSTKDNRMFHVYGYRLSLNPAKTVKSIELPNDAQVKILAMTLT